MIGDRLEEILRAAHAEISGVRQVIQRFVVLLQLEFAETFESVRERMFRLQSHDMAERIFRFRVLIEVIELGAERPIPFNVRRPELDGFLIQGD